MVLSTRQWGQCNVYVLLDYHVLARQTEMASPLKHSSSFDYSIFHQVLYPLVGLYLRGYLWLFEGEELYLFSAVHCCSLLIQAKDALFIIQYFYISKTLHN